jgi:16S rRNA (adenine1518-N6/adenine1519-N6)-dimethyltransferase
MQDINDEPFRHQARKRFGQNFLHDQNIIRRIIAAAAPQPEDHIVEIGPGQGALTRHLVNSNVRLDAVELDRDLAAWLQQTLGHMPNFTLHQADILKFDLAPLAAPQERLRIIGNLPYNISTPCLFHLFRYHALIKDMIFMLQLEVVQRLAAQVGDDNYGRLGIMAQYYCAIEPLFTVPPGAFTPQPKVTSAIVRLTPYQTLPLVADDLNCFQNVVRTAFNQRRKTLRNCLRGLISAEQLSSISIDSNARPENLSLADYVTISNLISSTPAGAASAAKQ